MARMDGLAAWWPGKLFVRRKAMASFMAIMFSLTFPAAHGSNAHERDEIKAQGNISTQTGPMFANFQRFAAGRLKSHDRFSPAGKSSRSERVKPVQFMDGLRRAHGPAWE
jgi:hypothetical protein